MASVNPEFGATMARRLNQSRVSAVLQLNLITIKVSVNENLSTLLDFGFFFKFLARVGPKFYFGRKRKSESAF